MEASIMIGVLKQLIAKGVKALSIHDCIVVNNEEDIKLAEKLIAEALMRKYGIHAKFKSEKGTKNFVAPTTNIHENIEWFKQFQGIEIEGNMCKLEGCIINMKTLKVRFNGNLKWYRYGKKGLLKLILEKQNQKKMSQAA
jgi:hypothetical protein